MGGEREMRATGGGGDCGGAAIVDGEKLAGVSKSRARGLHFQIKGYSEGESDRVHFTAGGGLSWARLERRREGARRHSRVEP
jgi:hypothetical protein